MNLQKNTPDRTRQSVFVRNSSCVFPAGVTPFTASPPALASSDFSVSLDLVGLLDFSFVFLDTFASGKEDHYLPFQSQRRDSSQSTSSTSGGLPQMFLEV